MQVDFEDVCRLVHVQAANIWNYTFESNIDNYVYYALNRCEVCFSRLKNDKLGSEFSQYYSTQYSIFLYYLSRVLYLDGYCKDANVIYYLNKNLNCVEWFYEVDLPCHFGAEHPIKSVLGRAQYGDFLFVYQGTTIGGSRVGEGKIIYPILGNNIIMYANSTVIGNCVIGNNVIFSANSYVINANIPDNSIVFGRDKNINIVHCSEKEMLRRIGEFWKISE